MKRKSSKKMDMNSLLRSRNTLYLVLFLSVMNLFSYLMLKQLDAVAFFIIVGFLATYFSKNMIIVLLAAMVSTFLLVQVRLLGNSGREGLKMRDASGNVMKDEKDKDEKDKDEKSEDKDTKSEDKDKKMDEKDKKTDEKKEFTGKEREEATKPSGDLKTANSEKKEKFTQQLNPARYNAADDDDTPRHKPKVDYSATLESAYDNLDKLLSSDAIRNMSEDTGRLAEKQQKLMGNIQKLTPIMDKASSVLQGLDIGGISGLMNGIQERMKGFGKQGDEGMEIPKGKK